MTPCMTAAEMRSLTGLPLTTDEEATVAIIAAQQVAEGYLNRVLVRSEQDETFDLCGRRSVNLQAYPVDTLTYVELDGETVTGVDVCFKNGILSLPWIVPSGSVLRVQYTGGFALDAIPMPIKVALALIWRAISYAGDNSGQQVVSERLDGYSVTYVTPSQAVDGLERLAPAAAALLSPYRGRAW